MVYALVATPVACVGGFYFGILLFTRVVPFLQGLPRAEVGWAEFVFSLIIAAGCGASAFLYALTLPGRRKRKRKGRPWRMALSALVVLVVSVTAQVEGIPLRYTIGLMIWLSVSLPVTFIRYGVLDQASRRDAPPTTGLIGLGLR